MKNESCHSFGDLISLGYKEKRNPYVAGVIPPLGWELYQAGEVNNLPPEIINNKKLVEQVSLRKDLHQLFDRVFQAIPNPTINIEEAAKEGLTDEYTVRELWDGVTDFLEQDENNVRILLYLPFELLPNPSSLDKLSKQTAESGSRLLDVYKWGWIRLLHQVESRANFIDGDVLEPGLGEPERISKAGHFIPELIKRGIVSYDDICLLLESIKNEDLLRSVAEGATVAIENGLLDKISSDEIKAIIEEKVGKVLAPSTRQNRSFFDYHSSIISPERAAWLRLVEMNEINENESDILAQEIICDASFKRINLEGKSREVVARGIIKAGKLLASEDLTKARSFAITSLKSLAEIWNSQDTKAKNIIIGGLNHWLKLGIVNGHFLQEFDISPVDLSTKIQFENKNLLKELDTFFETAEKIKENEYLAKSLYPAVLLFGSQLKGYADLDADFDVALFFRPEANFHERKRALKVLRREIPKLKNVDKILQFWITFEEGKMQFIIPQENTRIFAGEDQIHFLMGGLWLGCEETIGKIRSNVLSNYLNISRFGEKKEEARSCWLGQIELDVLQYRLMHKGYRKFYPLLEREKISHGELIDWESDFWDQGFRRLATKLFLSRVFLPDLS